MSAWNSFRRLVAYYRDCVQAQERKGPIFKLSKLDRVFCVPVLAYGWLRELGPAPTKGISVPVDDGNRFVVTSLLTRAEFDEEIFIGYPTEVFRWNKTTFCAPIAMIPAEIDFKNTNHFQLRLKLRTDEASINQAWLEHQFPREEQQTFRQVLDGLHRDDSFVGLTDVKRALPFFAKFARAENAPRLDPNDLCLTFPQLKRDGQCRLCNTPILFIGQSGQYTRTLEKELRFIAEQPDSVLDKTALAYVFREPPLPEPERENFYAFPFIDSNDEQYAAVSAALESVVSKVTGPPGTGKSQVAVNAVANLILHEKTVLFTSKNHKAIHAIFERCASFAEKSGRAPVQFCSSPDGSVGNPWTKIDVPAQCVSAIAARQGAQEVLEARKEFFDAEDEWKILSEKMLDRERRSREYAKLQKRAESLEKAVAEWRPLTPRELKRIANDLCPRPGGKGLRAGTARLLWKIFRKRKHEAALARIDAARPYWRESFIDVSIVKKRLRRITAQMLLERRNAAARAKLEKNNAKDEAEFSRERGFKLSTELSARAAEHAWNALACALSECSDIDAAAMRGFQLRFAKTSIPANPDRDAQKFSKILSLVPAWATTLLSLRQASPCLPAVFDRVIIDEASQCDVPPIIPALFRAKGLVVVGDPAQFPPVRTLRYARNEYLRKRHQLTDDKFLAFDYLEQSAFSVVAQGSSVFLRAHFRCDPEIAEYFNRVFYQGKLDVFSAAAARSLGFKPGVQWINVRDSIDGEMNAVETCIEDLKKSRFNGTVGVITPLRELANRLKEKLNRYQNCFSKAIVVDTVNAFQGGERDVIIFMTGYCSRLTPGQKWYVTSKENHYIYNVAASRAKLCLTVIGDKERCAASGVEPLEKLALAAEKPLRHEPKPFESVWEERLFRAMSDAGIKATPQYPILGRRLDFAVIRNNVKLDVEVDGVRWHTTSAGHRKFDDHWRDAQISAAGWRVLRFWVYELERDMPACVEKIKSALN